MWRSSLGSDEQKACHAPWTGLDIPLIYSLNVCGINWSIQQEKDKKEKTPRQSLLLCSTIRPLCWLVPAQVEIYSGMKWIAQKHQKSMFESGKIRVRLAIEIMSHLDAYNFPAEWKAKWHVTRFSLHSLFLRAACSRFAALPASPTHVSSLIFCITLFKLMLGDIHIPARVSDGTHIPTKPIIWCAVCVFVIDSAEEVLRRSRFVSTHKLVYNVSLLRHFSWATVFINGTTCALVQMLDTHDTLHVDVM